MDANEEQKIKRQRNAEHKKKEAAARQAIIDEIVAQSPKTAPDRSPASTRTARAIPAERHTFAKPKVAAYANGAGPQHRAMHSGSTALRTPAAITIEKTVSLALEQVQEEPVDEEKEDHATCSAASEHLMLDAEEQAADRKDRIRQYKQFAARVEKKRQLQDAARAQTKQDDADAEIQMLVAAEVNRQTKQDQTVRYRTVKDPMNIYLNAAHGVTSHWCKMGGDHFSNCLSDPLLQRHIEDLTRDLSGTAAFLSYGRLGWELQDLPREVFEEAELLLPELRAHLIHVTQYKGGERLTGALEAMENIEARLKSIWLMKLAKGDQRLDEDMDEA